MALAMGICGGLVGPKSGNVEKVLVLKALLKGSREQRVFYENEQPDEKWRLGGGRERVNPPPGACLEVWEDWRVCCWFGASTRLEARGLGGFQHNSFVEPLGVNRTLRTRI